MDRDRRVFRGDLADQPIRPGRQSIELRLDPAQEFFGEPDHEFPGTAAALAKVTEAAETCAAFRAREGASVAEYLEAAY